VKGISQARSNWLAGRRLATTGLSGTVAEEALSASTDVGLIVIKAWYSFSRLFDFSVASKGLISFFTIYDRAGIFLCRNSFVVFALMDSVL